MFFVNLKNVVNSDFSPLVRTIALRLSTLDYLSLGDFLKSLSQAELDELMQYADSLAVLGDEVSEDLQSIVLVAEMAAQAEGGDINEPDEKRVASFVSFLAIEGLYRRGLVRFKRENATLIDDVALSDLVELV